MSIDKKKVKKLIGIAIAAIAILAVGIVVIKKKVVK